jgi:serine/threonine protein kinase
LGVGSIFCPGCRSNITAEAPTCTVCSLQRPPNGWPVDEQVGRSVHGKYRIDKRLSAGGFGTVFLAMQVHGGIEMGRVILKFLHREHAQDPNLTKRFLTEVKTARELINPHIVRVFDLGYDNDGTPFMVQEFIEGEGLEEVLAHEKRLPPVRALKIAIQVAEGMAEAHRKNIIHRDLKPENLRVQEGTGLMKILDFGIARVTTTRGTATNSFVGTPRYMPPEQIKQQTLDSGVDIFALGVIAFEMLAGEPPIRTEQSELEYIHLNLIQEPRLLGDLLEDCPPELSDFIHSMMQKDRAKRPKDMESVAKTLTEIAARHGWTDEESGSRFRLSSEAVGGRGATVALSTRERTPSPAATMPQDDEEVLELVPADRPKRAGFYVGIGGGAVALLFAVILIVVLSSRESPTGGAPSAAPEAATSTSVEAGLPPTGPTTASLPGRDASVTATADAVKVAVEAALAAVPDAVAASPDAGVAVKVTDAVVEATRPPIPDAGTMLPDVALPPPDEGVPPPPDGGTRHDRSVAVRDAGGTPPRDVASPPPPRDTGPSTPRDSGRTRDTGFQFTKIGSQDGSSPFTKIGGDGGR